MLNQLLLGRALYCGRPLDDRADEKSVPISRTVHDWIKARWR
ncbi:hypothetical protein [Amorphus sp. MBR-141]